MRDASAIEARLLLEIEGLIRAMPEVEGFGPSSEEAIVWVGKCGTILQKWNGSRLAGMRGQLDNLLESDFRNVCKSYPKIRSLLYEARSDIQFRLDKPEAVHFDKGQVFDYFEAIRRLIELADQDILVVDRYLDANFVRDYLTFVKAGVTVRLLTRNRLSEVLPAAKKLAEQSKFPLEIRTSQDFHDRYLFIDRKECYLSAASFKDGGKNAPATVTRISDAFDVVHNAYESIWAKAVVPN